MLEQIENEKKDLENNLILSNKNESNLSKELINLKIEQKIKKELKIKEELKKLEFEKFNLIHINNLYNYENNSIFFKNKDDTSLIDDKYKIIELIGKGGYSEVYKSFDLDNHKYVACKLNKIDKNWSKEIIDKYLEHTVRENQINKIIDNNNIVKYYDTVIIDDYSFCIIFEYCTGPDLATYMKQNNNIKEEEAKIIITQVLKALEYLNKLSNKIIHYDLKPENIIFNKMEIKICDFGLSKIMESNLDNIQLTSQGVGTYSYLPPECFLNRKDIKINTKVDVWSIGIILYEMLFNTKPFTEDFNNYRLYKEKIINTKKIEIPKEPYISKECKDFIENCLSYNQEDRYDIFNALNSSFILK